MRALMGTFVLTLALCFGLSGCGAAGSQATVTEHDFYSVVVPSGYRASDAKNVFEEIDGDGSFYVAVFNSSADELLNVELSSDSYERGDDLIANGHTYMSAVSDEWDTTYYITDWEDGCFEVKAQNVDDDEVVKAFLSSLTPAEDAYGKWQRAD